MSETTSEAQSPRPTPEDRRRERLRRQVEILVDIQFVLGEARFPGREAARAVRLMEYVDRKLRPLQRQLEQLVDAQSSSDGLPILQKEDSEP